MDSHSAPTDAEARRLRYAQGGSRSVGGWVSQADFVVFGRLDAFQKKAGIGGHFCEIGVFHGKRFIFFCLSLWPEEIAVAIDLFTEEQPDGGTHDFEPTFRANVARHCGDSAGLKVLRADSARVTAPDLLAVAEGGFRLFSVDGNHHAEPMARDLSLAARTLRPGGVIVVDDYFNERWPGVSEGTLRYLTSDEGRLTHLVPFAIFSTKVFLAHETHAGDYLADLHGADPAFAVVQTPFLGRSVGVVRFPPPATWAMRLAATPLWRALRGTMVGAAVRRVRSLVP